MFSLSLNCKYDPFFRNQHGRGGIAYSINEFEHNQKLDDNNDADFLIGNTIVILCLQGNQRASTSLIPLVGISQMHQTTP